jgi:radical SAM protein with 4Fe4S-binding SPASM domain
VLRILNTVQVVGAYVVSKLLREPIMWGFPLGVSIEPTTSCNLRCPECPSGLRNFTRPTGMLSMDNFTAVINQLYKRVTHLTFYFQGEPYLNKDFLPMVRYAASKKMYTITSTNAHYLNDDNAKATVNSGLSKLIISLDGVSQEVYEQYRVGGNVHKVLEGAANVVKWRKQLNSSTPQIVFQYLVVKPNEHEMQLATELTKTIGADHILFKTAQVYDYKNGNDLIPTNQQYSRYYKTKDGTWKIKNALKNHCWKLWNSCVITWDGKVVPCCFDKDAKYTMGNATQQSFKQIWHSASYTKFRTQVLLSRQNIDICANCSEGSFVWANKEQV